MKLLALGRLELEGASFQRAKSLLLLVYLSLEGKRPRKHLAELFWQEGSPRQRRNNLSKALSDLRAHAPGSFGADKTAVWSLVSSDVAEFQRAFEKKDYASAAKAYRGPFLAGHASGWSAELEEWLFEQRERLAEKAQEVLLELAEQSRPQKAVQYAQSAFRLAEPQLDMLPRFYALFRGRDASLTKEVRDLARDYGVTLDNEKKPSQKQENSETPPHNLPNEATSFVGRDVELAEIARQLSQPSCRLLSLVGIGGAGKSRLAVQAAYELLETSHFEGIYYVRLDALTAAGLIPSTVADSLGLNLNAQDTELRQLTGHLGARKLLLILDNFEHLMDGVAFIPKLLQGCPKLKIIVTSRERLNLEQEWVLPVEGLALLGEDVHAQDAQQSDAVQLFSQRAYQAKLTFDLTPDELPHVLMLCRLVAGLPLALELAAVWVKMMSPGCLVKEIETNLDVLSARNRGERRQSLRAVFEHSWALLTPQEQEVLKKLSVFRGGFTKEAAAHVAEASLTILTSLVDKSLLRVVASGRYERHPLLHQYTQEKLEADRPRFEQLQEKHFDYFLSLTEQAEPLLDSPEQILWLERLERNHDNFRAALSYALTCDSADRALSLTGRLWWFWYVRGYYTEGRGWLEKALAQPASASLQTRAQAIEGAGWLATQQGSFELATSYLAESLAIYRSLNQPRNIASSLNYLAGTAHYLGDFAKATSYSEEVLATYQSFDDKGGIARTLNNLGNIAFEQGELRKAYRLHTESLTLFQKLGDKKHIALTSISLGKIATDLGDYDSAHKLINQGLVISVEIGWKSNTARASGFLGTLARREHNYAQARANYTRCLLLRQELDEQVNTVYDLECFAYLYAQQKEWSRAACLLGAAQYLQESLGTPRAPIDQPEFEQVCKELKTQLTKAELLSAMQKGRNMTLEQAVSYALEGDSRTSSRPT